METRLDVISADKNRTYVIFVCDKHNPSHQRGGDINSCPFYAYLALLLFPQNLKRIPLTPVPYIYFKVNENFTPRIEKLT
jgi:hypothetical protein